MLLLSPLGVMAANDYLQMKRYTVEQGLSNSNVTAIMQDHNGFMWIGTANGLNCFDGSRFKAFKRDASNKNTICGNMIKCLYEDRNNNIWIGSLDGLVSRFDTRTETFTTYRCSFPMEINKGDVSAIAEDSKGTIWITVDRLGLVALDPKTGKITRYRQQEDTQNTLSHNAITDIVIDAKDNLYMTTWGGGLNVFTPRTNTFRHYLTKCSGSVDGECSHMMNIMQDKSGHIWVTTTHAGVFMLDKNMKPLRHFTTKGDERTTLMSVAGLSLVEDNAHKVWMGSSSGIDIYNPKDGTVRHVVNDDASFASAEVFTMMMDRDGSIWIGTSTALYVYTPSSSQFTKLRIPGMTTDMGNVLAMIKDRRNHVWVRTKERSVRFDAGATDGGVVNLNSHINGSEIKSFLEDSKGRVWIGYFNDNLTCYDPQTDAYRTMKLNTQTESNGAADGYVMPLRTINAMYEDRKGLIWLACEVGLACLDPETNKITSLIRSRNLIYPDEKCFCVLRDSKGMLWVGTMGGLRCYDQSLKLLNIYNPKEDDNHSLHSSEITALCEDTNGTLWVGTSNGLHRYNRQENNFTFVTRAANTVGDPIMSIIEDRNGTLWMSSSIGIMEYDTKRNTFKMYDRNDGLQPGEFNKCVGWMAKNGDILFGGSQGLNSFNPKDVKPAKRKSRVFLQDFLIYNKSVTPGPDSPIKTSIVDADVIELSYDQSTISLQFVALEFISPQKTIYAYRMEKVDNDWIITTADNHSATYANLQPGTYTFCVKATDSDGTWGEETRIKIVVNPPFWRTWWAYVFYAIAFTLLIYNVIRYYTEKEKARARTEMERIRVQQQHEMDDLKLQIFANISHEFRTSLTLILSPLEFILSHPKPTADTLQILQIMHRNALRLMRLINQLLDFRKHETGQMVLNASTLDIVSFVSDVYDTFLFDAKQRGLDFTFTKEVDRLVMDFDADKLDKILYNLLSNALKYTNAGGKVELSLSHNTVAENVVIKVRDNGIGIDAKDEDAIFRLFYQSMGSDGKFRGGSGLGLNMTREMVLLHGGDIKVDSTLGKGSCFTVTLPVKKSNIKAETLPDQFMLEDTTEPTTTEDKAQDKQKGASSPLILVVEDNIDMREYISRILSPYYRIETAEDGVEGLRVCEEVMPDIIISDLMMPKMDGLEMLQRLKADSKIGHIPVVMLTAVSDEQTVVRSLQTGVDEYVTKPFNASVLKARMDNIIARRKDRLQVTEYNDTYVSPFMEQMRMLIRKNMSNPELNVEWLASEMNMSASQLTRKTKTLTDTTPYRIVIQTRMDEAVNLMKTTDLNATEIAYRCGYQEISNFSRAFTSYWKKSPAAYIKEVRTT